MLQRCLDKDNKRRVQDISEAQHVIADAIRQPDALEASFRQAALKRLSGASSPPSEADWLALLQKELPELRRRARGRVPAAEDLALDVDDLVQEAVITVLPRLRAFDPQHIGAVGAHLRETLINRWCSRTKRPWSRE